MKEFEFEEQEFIKYCKQQKNSERTICSKIASLKYFYKNYNILNEDTYNDFYEDICDRCKPNSINSKILSINDYIRFLQTKYNVDLSDWLKRTVQVKKVQFLEDIFSIEDYLFFMNKAKTRNKDKLYIICKIMATTGMRIHETLNIRREHIEIGFIDFIGKGGKERRCYFTPSTQNEVLELLDKHGVTDKRAYIISAHWNGKQLSWKDLRSTQKTMKNFAENECEFKKGLFHPHAFRHFFAKNFIKKYQNIALLADLLGHSSIDTTRIYLKYTSKEQQEIVNEIVTW